MESHCHKFSKQHSKKTCALPEDVLQVKGYDFNKGVDHRALLQTYINVGFQATSFGLAVQQINTMIEKRQQPVEDAMTNHCAANTAPESPGFYEVHMKEPCPCRSGCNIFLSYTSNQITCGVRESIRYLAEHKMVDVLVTTAGGIEEDIMKCLSPFYLGDFALSGQILFEKGMNRAGNLLVTNDTYLKLEAWIMPILKQMLLEQNTQGVRWTPSKMIHRLGKEINNPESVYYWAYKNNIPVFSPALTDGAIGDCFYLFSLENPGLVLDTVADVASLNNIALSSQRTGIICLGAGVPKHHVCNANIWRDGADYSVYVNTGQEFDGSDSGASPDEAVSWGKIKTSAKPVKVFADASVIFPLLVAETFAVHAEKRASVKQQ